MSEDIKNYMGHLWYSKEDDIITIGINEDALEDFDAIESFDLPEEQARVEADEVCGSLETSDGPLDIYCPVDGTVVEINSAAIDSPELIMDDPYGEGWLIKVSAEDALDDDDEDEDEDDDDDDYDDEEEDEDED